MLTNSWLPLQHSASHCITLQHTATHCNTLHRTATHLSTGRGLKVLDDDKQIMTNSWLPPQHTAKHYKPPQHTAKHCNTLQRTKIQCNNRNTGRTLEAFDDDKMVPAYGLGDTCSLTWDMYFDLRQVKDMYLDLIQSTCIRYMYLDLRKVLDLRQVMFSVLPINSRALALKRCMHKYGVATISRLLKYTRLFSRTSSLF